MHARGQSRYQVRFGWGVAGAARIARDAHLLAWVDVLPPADHAAPDAAARHLRGVVATLPEGPEVLLAHLGNASAIAGRVTALQGERGDRCVVAIVAAGIDDPAPGDAGAAAAGEDVADRATAPDFAVEDLLAAGALVDALAEVGIDACSPEAAAACAAFTGLRRAVGHLVTASASAAELTAAGRRDQVTAALEAGPASVTLRREQQRRA